MKRKPKKRSRAVAILHVLANEQQIKLGRQLRAQSGIVFDGKQFVKLS